MPAKAVADRSLRGRAPARRKCACWYALAAGGSLGILIPPSIIMVIYAAIAEQSVPRLFAAGLIPGLVLTALYMLVVIIVTQLRKDYAPAGAPVPWRERLAPSKAPGNS